MRCSVASIVFVAFASTLVGGSARGVAASSVPPQADDDGWIDGKLQSMSVREKLGQMFMIDVSGTELTPSLAAHLRDGAYGGVIFFDWNVESAAQTAAFIRQLQDLAVVETGVPLLVAVDQEGGPVDRLGALLGVKSTKHSARTIGQVYAYDRDKAESLVGAVTRSLAARMRRLGFNMNLAPVLDLTDDKTSYIYERSYGGDPETVARIAAQFADVMRAQRIVATGKHFPNLSVTQTDSHLGMPVLGRGLEDLMGHELVPFARLKDHLGAVMMGHLVVPDIDPLHPASVSPKAGKVLRDRLGWEGVVISDDLKMKALTDRYPLNEIVEIGRAHV